MECGLMLTYENDNSLLLSVRHGNLDILEKYLLSVSNPNKYLNQLYDEGYNQKCTLLTIACLHRYDDIIRMILQRFKPDLEIKNDILFGDGNKSQQMCFNVTVLWTAAATNNFEMVKLFVEHGANVNHTTKTNSTPLRSACYNGNIDMARYLIEHGANINIAKENNDTNLAVSVYRKHLNMASYLVDELGCDVNMCDNDGRPPLYDAVNCGSLELVQFLLDHGARNFPAICDKMSPLMWAAEKRRTNLVDAISSHCSLIEQIEAKELLGSAFACADLEDRDFEEAFQHFIQALHLRSVYNLPKKLTTTTIDLFNHKQECQTIDQLNEIYSNHALISIEALLIRERLLGPNNVEYRYSLRYHGAILADNNQHYQAMAFWMYELGLREKYSINMDSENLRHFASMFSEMIFVSLAIPIENLLTVIKVTNEELKRNTVDFDFNLHTLLFLITITSQFLTKMNVPVIDRREIYRYLRSINQHKYVTHFNGSSLLHLSLDSSTLVDDSFIERTCKYPCLVTARTLLQCGADVNEPDAMRNTPLHIFLSNSITCDETIIKLLCDAGAHLDYVNIRRETAIDVAPDVVAIRQLLKSKMKSSLKCLCARLIQHNNVPFRRNIPILLVRFVEEH
ncbi:unnamed protein product [Rotaria sp. Silwood2]|nr:unnamed protein product [Rotaria sp. Silwood2]CAF2711362.1 unnamed protein product [Rotaria sp. Silwood2]CAF3140600.1 unnamed protein product [Rotaria sp. Silwood2]CAF4404586.1 unnamed protein product [Rotaria sp. Silwood2]CAF4459640.1 unnamed protein product [Rotaria sp. Silwood2]